MEKEVSKQKLAFLVNDNLLAETMLVRLQKKGFSVNIYRTREAFETAVKNADYPDALIIDMDDFDLPSISITCNEKLKIFALSNKDDMDTRLRAVQSHVRNFILKPIDAGELTKEISSSFGLESRKTHDLLIVDDDPLTLKLCQKILEPQDIRLRFVENPINILDELEHHKPDLILLDYYMPYANGLDIHKVIRQVYSAPEIPVIFMTGSKDPRILADIHEESKFLPVLKPVNQSKLVENLLGVLSR